jgi:hypothetical protein
MKLQLTELLHVSTELEKENFQAARYRETGVLFTVG